MKRRIVPVNQPSWFGIIFWFVIFWPVGVYLLIKRATHREYVELV
jgi:hypothetical protein